MKVIQWISWGYSLKGGLTGREIVDELRKENWKTMDVHSPGRLTFNLAKIAGIFKTLNQKKNIFRLNTSMTFLGGKAPYSWLGRFANGYVFFNLWILALKVLINFYTKFADTFKGYNCNHCISLVILPKNNHTEEPIW